MQAKVLSNRTVEIRELNDAFRRSFSGGRVMLSSAVAALDTEAQGRIIAAIKSFDDFNCDNDPHGEHDFVAVKLNDETFFWKVDYYDRDIRYGSEDPSDPNQTVRIATIMHSSEY